MKKVIVIGAGPVGLYLAGCLNKANISHLVLEAGDVIGGQLTALYPEKEIVDLATIKSILAKDYISLLAQDVNLDNFHLKKEVIDIKSYEDYVEVITKEGVYEAEYAIIATGLGFYKPKPIGLAREKEFSNIIYSLTSFDFLKGKNVVVFGGGDSALDWAKEISKIADNIYLVHRRKEFRGNFETIKDIKEIEICTPFVPKELIIKDNNLIGITIKHAEEDTSKDLYIDYILVNFGNIPSPVVFNVPKQNTGIICDEYRCVLNRVYVAGDAIGMPGKIKRIGDGLKDADSILNLILKF